MPPNGCVSNPLPIYLLASIELSTGRRVILVFQQLIDMGCISYFVVKCSHPAGNYNPDAGML
jgi:hypothetical protein